MKFVCFISLNPILTATLLIILRSIVNNLSCDLKVNLRISLTTQILCNNLSLRFDSLKIDIDHLSLSKSMETKHSITKKKEFSYY